MSYKPAPLEGADFQEYVRREFVKIAAEFLALQPPQPNPDVLWRWDATSLAPFGIQAKDSSRVTFVNAGGRPAVRLLTMPGDFGIAGSGTSERCDISLSQADTDGYEGKEAWWAHSILFPDDYVDPPESNTANGWQFGVVFDFHNTSSGSGQANYQVMAMPKTATSPDRPRGINTQIAFGDQSNPTTIPFPASGTAGVPVLRNVWYDFVYHVRWTQAATGYFFAWLNGKPIMEYGGPTLYAGQGVYLKLANYHTAFGKPSAVLHGRVVRARTREALV